VTALRPIACIGLGANLGDARAAIEAAVGEIAALPRTGLVARSSIYRSEPVAASGPDFLNAVVAVRTGLAPEALLDHLQAIETRHGRERPYRNAPRTLDLDLLLHGDTVCSTARLVLPHPRMHERAFVLVPLAEIAPELRIPGRGPLAVLLPGVARQRIDKLAG
jgi:2-amino-4-hydroxy-6-hydroxymethyldihydropteridine diphosphokinase